MPSPTTWTAYLGTLGWGWALAGGLMLVLWLRQLRTRNATSVDVAWSAALGLLAILYAVVGTGLPLRRLLIGVVVGLWSGRLTLHLYLDRVRGNAGEDGRYRTLRAEWGERATRNFFLFYQAQAALAVLLSIPFLMTAMNPAASISILEYAGAALMLVALAGESLADMQLARHRADPANRGVTCRTGLWSVSRHPNYFFEWLNWCAFAMIALTAPYGWIALFAPLLMLYLILEVTGIPPTEAQAVASRGEDYREYQRTVSPFFPWPSRSSAAKPQETRGTR